MKTSILTPVQPPTIEGSLAWIADDEIVEITPKYVRLRKRVLIRINVQLLRAPKEEEES